MSNAMTIKMMGNTVEVKSNSEVAVKRAICKLFRMNKLTFGTILSYDISEGNMTITYQAKKATWGHWVEKKSVTIPVKVVEVEAPVAEEVAEFELPKYGTFRTQIWTTGPNGYWAIEEVK